MSLPKMTPIQEAQASPPLTTAQHHLVMPGHKIVALGKCTIFMAIFTPERQKICPNPLKIPKMFSGYVPDRDKTRKSILVIIIKFCCLESHTVRWHYCWFTCTDIGSEDVVTLFGETQLVHCVLNISKLQQITRITASITAIGKTLNMGVQPIHQL